MNDSSPPNLVECTEALTRDLVSFKPRFADLVKFTFEINWDDLPMEEYTATLGISRFLKEAVKVRHLALIFSDGVFGDDTFICSISCCSPWNLRVPGEWSRPSLSQPYNTHQIQA